MILAKHYCAIFLAELSTPMRSWTHLRSSYFGYLILISLLFLIGGGRPGTSYSSYNTAMSNSFGVNSQYSYTPTSTLRSGMPSSSYGPSQSGFVSPRNVMGGGTSYGGSYMPSQSLQQAFTTFRQFGGVPPMPATSLDQMRVGWHPPHNLQTPHSLQRTSGHPPPPSSFPPFLSLFRVQKFKLAESKVLFVRFRLIDIRYRQYGWFCWSVDPQSYWGFLRTRHQKFSFWQF